MLVSTGLASKIRSRFDYFLSVMSM